MSKLQELIQKLCPDGAEYKRLGDVCEIKRGVRVTRSSLVDGGAFSVFQNSLTPLGNFDRYNRDADKTFVICAGAAGEIGYSDKPFWAADDCFTIEAEKLHNRYVYHFLLANKDFLKSKVRKASVPRVSATEIGKLVIPIPHPDIQEEIVRILDNFTNLAAELQARQEQYQYYRDTLLSFDGRTDVQWKKLGEVCIYAKERIGADLVDENNYVSVENLLPNQRGKEKASNVPKEGNCIKFEPNDVLLGNIRPYLHKIWYADCVGGTNGDVLCIRIKDYAKNVIIPRYLYCILSSHSFFEYDNSYSKGAKMPRGDKQKVMEYVFGIPSLSEQQHIVDILDRFDTLTNDLTQGLPAEIEVRQQQYEYYRDQLLTFKRKEA